MELAGACRGRHGLGAAGSAAPWPKPSRGRGATVGVADIDEAAAVAASVRARGGEALGIRPTVRASSVQALPTPRSRQRSSSRRPERVPPITDDRVPRWIETPPALAEVSRRLRAPGEVALDTEGDSLHHYRSGCRSSSSRCRRATSGWSIRWRSGDLSPLASVFAAPSVTTVLHAGDNDLVQLKRRGIGFTGDLRHLDRRALPGGQGARPRRAARDVCRGGAAAPRKQRDDWSRRPLSEAQRRYAEADVLHLFALKQRLTEELDRVGRLAWVEEECAALAALPAIERRPDPNAFAGLKGARDLPPRGLAILRELYELRESLARLHGPSAVQDSRRRDAGAPGADAAGRSLGTGGNPGCTPKVIARWGEASPRRRGDRAQALPETDWPTLERHPRPRIPGIVARRIEALRQWRKDAAAALRPRARSAPAQPADHYRGVRRPARSGDARDARWRAPLAGRDHGRRDRCRARGSVRR
jgi:ribonuclease D